MFDLFGAEMPLAVRFFLAFLIVLGLIGVAAWAVRRFGSARLGGAVRGRQPRLSVTEYASIDARRRLLLVRRDNIEHLVMIGGPSDIVVEANIVRAVPAARETSLPRTGGPIETLPRPIPLPETNGSTGSWPLQPEAPTPPPPLTPPRRAPRIEPIGEEHASAPLPPTASEPRLNRDALAAIADDLSAHTPPATPVPPRNRLATPPRPQVAETRAEQRAEPRIPPQSASIEPSAADQSLAEMAQRLEAALRKPKAAEPRAAAPATEQSSEPEAAAPAAAPPPAAPRPTRAEAKPARTEAKPKEASKESKALYDTLEQEMASLLGRPAGKT
jgi:hypothetical protein